MRQYCANEFYNLTATTYSKMAESEELGEFSAEVIVESIAKTQKEQMPRGVSVRYSKFVFVSE
jgi:hypothetical protein